ncbi:S1 family peptidase [Nonomuraea endophytica]|uniref:S1 family peptidase n=1 Tax=Nonomuraea endophytica TaxID=714136 RepID=UPI0037C98AF6
MDLLKLLREYAKDFEAKNPSVRRASPEGPVPDPRVDIDGIPFAQLIDLNQLAKDKGYSFEEAITRYGWMPAFTKFSDTLEATFPDDLAGKAIVDDGNAIRVAFKGAIPQQVIDLAKALPVEVTLTGNKGFSHKEITEARYSSLIEISRRPEVADVIASHDYETGIITLTIELKQEPAILAREDQIRASLQPAPSSNPKLIFKMKFVDDLGFRPADSYLRGGGYLEKNGNAHCTAGFNAINRNTEVKNAVTAKHCTSTTAPSLSYRNHVTGGTTVTRAAAAPGYDLARLSGGSLTHTRTFYYATDTTRYATARDGVPDVGQPICSFGRSTALVNSGQSRCGTVTDVSDHPATGPNTIYTDYAIIGGDSGGPSYLGNTAIGINSSGGFGKSALASVGGYAASTTGFGADWALWICAAC